MKTKLYKKLLRHIWLTDLKLEAVRVCTEIKKLAMSKSYRKLYRDKGYVLFSRHHVCDCMFRWRKTEIVRFARIWKFSKMKFANEQLFKLDVFRKRYEKYSRKYWISSSRLSRAIETGDES